MNYLKIEKTSIVNGAGIRVVLWCAGCSIHCKGCHNPQSWSLQSGKPFDDNAKRELYEAIDKPYIKGITLSGGHPLEYENLPDVYEIIKYVRDNFPDKNIWLYTGYELTPSDFNTDADIGWDNSLLRNYILALCDVVVDGRYIESLRDITLRFRGSSNQRIINVRKTIEQNQIMLWDE